MTQQNPIQKAHLEGIKMFDEKFPCINTGCGGHGIIAVQIAEDEWEPQQCQYCYEVRMPFKSFLTSYAESILNAALEAVGEEQKMVGSNWLGAGDYRKENSKRSGHNSCRTSYRSAINEGIKLIK